MKQQSKIKSILESKFGLLYIDHERSNYKRSITNGAKIYSFVIKESLHGSEKVSKSVIIRTKENFEAFTDEGNDIVN